MPSHDSAGNALDPAEQKILHALCNARGSAKGIQFEAVNGLVTRLSIYPHDELAPWVLPPETGGLKALRDFFLDGTALREELPEALSGLCSLEDLHLHAYPFARLPEGIGTLPKLDRIYIVNSALTALPESFGLLRALTSLRVNIAPLAVLPESLGKLQALELLQINATSLERLPDSLGGLAALRECLLANNMLRTLPATLGGCVQLEDLDLSGNRLGSVPEALFSLSSLQRLSLHGNGIGGPLPPALFCMPLLRYLNLSENAFVGSAPPELATAPELSHLILTNNAALAGQLPACLASQKMRTLALWGTDLSLAPEDAAVFQEEMERERDSALHARQAEETDDSGWPGPALVIPHVSSPVRLCADGTAFASGGKRIALWGETYSFTLSFDMREWVETIDTKAAYASFQDSLPKIAEAVGQLAAMSRENILLFAARGSLPTAKSYLSYGTLDDRGEYPMRTPEELARHLYVGSVLLEMDPDADIRLEVGISSYEYVFGGHSMSVIVENGTAVSWDM